MKHTIFLLLIVFFSCKNEKKVEQPQGNDADAVTEEVNEIKVISEVKTPTFTNWFNSNIDISENSSFFQGEPTYFLTRNNPEKGAHMAMNNLKVNEGSNYRVSVILKKGEAGSHFGLRFQGVYPNRVDVVFNLEKGNFNGPIGAGDLSENEQASIEDLGDGWYKCSLTTELYTNYVRVMLGPTKNTMKRTLWETRTLTKDDIIIVPSSLKIEELSN